MITGEYKQLTDIIANNVCAEHKMELTVAWDGEQGEYFVRCGQGEYPEAVTRKTSAVTQIRQNPGIALPAGAFPLPDTDAGDKSQLTIAQQRQLVDYARQYGLDAYRGHVVIMYGKPYIGLDGYLYHANRSQRSYKLITRPLAAEVRNSMQIAEGDHAWLAELSLLNPEQYFTGIGIVTQAEVIECAKGRPDQPRYPVVARHPQQLAQKRAEWQALRRGFPIGEDAEPGPPGTISHAKTEYHTL